MDNALISFRVKVEHGCFIVRDAQGEEDVSEWDPTSENWYRSGSSVIFGVLPGSEGWVECEIWNKRPAVPLPINLISEEILPNSGWMVVHDPSEHVWMKFRGAPDSVRISVLVNDFNFASKIQIIVE
ncbi:hypothetical protein [Actinorugispora endophytica]|uniref:hypothetical protein n=1 Tax=Actinorugispora endophytica TaxID=1605990 RepID=UPI00105C88D3|nr:hypothetical protein [Actinorugispora endophytica]